MKKQLFALALVSLAASYSASMLGRRHKKSPDEIRLEEISEKIKKLEEQMGKAETRCEEERGYKKGVVCRFANEEISAKGINLLRLKAMRNSLRAKMDEATENGGKGKK